MTPTQALQSATIVSAKFSDKSDELGTIEKGKIADLVLLNANPLVNINNTRKIFAVVANGRYFSKKELQKMLDRVETAIKAHVG